MLATALRAVGGAEVLPGESAHAPRRGPRAPLSPAASACVASGPSVPFDGGWSAPRAKSSTRTAHHDTSPKRPVRRSLTASACTPWFDSHGMYLYDLDGKLLWHKDSRRQESALFGEAGTPVLFNNRLVIVLSSLSVVILSLDAYTGKEICA